MPIAKLPKPLKVVIDDEEDDGSAGDAGRSGFGEPPFDMSVFGLENFQHANFELMNELRAHEKKFASVPHTKDPNKKRQHEAGMGEGPPTHPKLADTSYFSGIADDNNPSPPQNSEAVEAYREHQLTHTPRPGQQKVSAPVFRPGGG